MLGDFDEDIPGKKRQKRHRSDAQLGYALDSDDNPIDLDDSDDESKKSEKEIAGSDDDMFASDTEEKPKGGFDLDKFEREQGLGQYDEEAELNVKQPHEAKRQNEPIDDEKVIDYYNNIEDLDETEIRNKPTQEVQMEAFNLREEVENGEFDKDMNYMRKNESDDDKEEAWMENVGARDIERAKTAQLRQEQEAQKEHEYVATEKLLRDIIAVLEPAETPLEALARLRPKKTKRRNKKDVSDGGDDQDRKAKVFTLTESCERLLNDKGISQIYDTTREEMMRAYKKETGEAFQDQSKKRPRDEDDSVSWEYRWLDEQEWNGPHSTYEMSYWKDNYFENNVEIRPVGSQQAQHISTIDFNE